MNLRLRARGALKTQAPEQPAAERAPASTLRSKRTAAEIAYQNLKLRVHRLLLERLDLGNLARLDIARANVELRTAIRQLVDEQPTPMSQRDRAQLAEEILNEVHGLGPIEPLMRDPEISDILVNSSRQVYIERLGKLESTPVIFRDDAHLLQIIDRIVSKVGRRIDESSPMVDARLPDGSRVNAIIPPLALDGPMLSIRRFGTHRMTMDELVRLGSLPPEMVDVIRAMVLRRLNILISGGTGSGKTTLLNCISAFIPDTERIVTIEDSAELLLQQPHVVRLETRPENIERRGEVTQRDLLRNSLRMRPDRIIIGEVRGAESLDMLQAMNTGHDGSISTVHANAARDSLNRLEMMMQMAGFNLPTRAMRQQIASAIDIVIQTARFSDGSRKITCIAELAGMEGDTIGMQELFVYRREGIDANGTVLGRFVSTGIRPRFADDVKTSSYELDPSVFDYLTPARTR
jgi:pilus assembly protein CpaF